MTTKTQNTHISNSTSAAKLNGNTKTLPKASLSDQYCASTANVTEGFFIPITEVPFSTANRRPKTDREKTLAEFGSMLKEYSLLSKWGHEVSMKAPHTNWPYLSLANLTIYLDPFNPECNPPKFEIHIDEMQLPMQLNASEALDFINSLTALNKRRYEK